MDNSPVFFLRYTLCHGGDCCYCYSGCCCSFGFQERRLGLWFAGYLNNIFIFIQALGPLRLTLAGSQPDTEENERSPFQSETNLRFWLPSARVSRHLQFPLRNSLCVLLCHALLQIRGLNKLGPLFYFIFFGRGMKNLLGSTSPRLRHTHRLSCYLRVSVGGSPLYFRLPSIFGANNILFGFSGSLIKFFSLVPSPLLLRLSD